ncbi:GGDEF domain-containing protein [Mesorhizobium sp. IMUNJ 23232]|uniref:GGDEF domain-containing protein n=1 Tax=Mesorhizobium sp. IMUNJ 23232 TaxID=3376064 RepID=UPI0037B5A06F
MDQSLFISLLNPAVSGMLSLAFLVIWAAKREHRHVLLLGLCYLCVGAGFVLQGFSLGMPFEAAKFLSNLLFFCAVFLLARAVIARQALRVPVFRLAACGIAGMAVFSWFLFLQPDFVARIFAVNYGLGAMCVVIALSLRKARKLAFVDRLLIWLAALRALDFFIRPVVVALFENGHSEQMPYITSAYWLTTSLSVILFSVLIALTLLTTVAFDAMQELRIQSRTDALSGLLNRRGFEEETAPFFDQTKRKPLPLGLVLADLDHFKLVNDRHGHAVGDAVITAFASLLRQAGAGKAIIGRTGGEEFAVFMPQCDLGASRLFAEGLRAALSTGALEGVTPDLGLVTCSFGVAARAGDESLAALFKRADDALMQAKRAGRDRVRVTYIRSEGDSPIDVREWRAGT